jgi:hypothetical protein
MCRLRLLVPALLPAVSAGASLPGSVTEEIDHRRVEYVATRHGVRHAAP